MSFTADTRDFTRISDALRKADTGVSRELTKAIADVAKPFGQYVLVAGAARLPRKGGLSYRVGSGKVTTQVSPLKAAITLRQGKTDLKDMDTGTIRHPVFGRRVWVSQTIPAGVFREPFESDAPMIRGALQTAADRIINAIQ